MKGVGWENKKRSPQVRQHQAGAPKASTREALMGIMLPPIDPPEGGSG